MDTQSPGMIFVKAVTTPLKANQYDPNLTMYLCHYIFLNKEWTTSSRSPPERTIKIVLSSPMQRSFDCFRRIFIKQMLAISWFPCASLDDEDGHKFKSKAGNKVFLVFLEL